MTFEDMQAEMKLMWPRELIDWGLGHPPAWFWDTADGHYLKKFPEPQRRHLASRLVHVYHQMGFGIVRLLRYLLK